MQPINRLQYLPTIEELLPTTKLDRLFSEDDRRLFEPQAQETPITREFFEQEARKFSSTMPREELYTVYYPLYYELTRDYLAAGLSRDELHAQLSFFVYSDVALLVVISEAMQDALADRPPRYTAEEAE